MTIDSDMTLLWFAARVDPAIRDAVGRIDDYIREGYHAPLGTCHWTDDCDEAATEWRWYESDLMHYPVCERHSPETAVWELVSALEAIQSELGVPQPGYPQPIANAYQIATDAVARIKGESHD